MTLAIEFLCLYGKVFEDVTCGLRAARTKSFLALDFRRKGYEVEIETISSMLRHRFVVRTAKVRGVRYERPSTVGRGFAITAKLGLAMLATRLFQGSAGPRKDS